MSIEVDKQETKSDESNNGTSQQSDVRQSNPLDTRRKRIWLSILLFVLVFFSLSSWGTYRFFSSVAKRPTPAAVAQKTSPTANVAEFNFFEMAKLLKDDLGLFKDSQKHRYYQVGTTADDKRIIAATFEEDTKDSDAFTAIEDAPGRYTVLISLTNYTDPDLDSYKKEWFSDKVTTVSKKSIPVVFFPGTVKKGSVELKLEFPDYPAGYFIPSEADFFGANHCYYTANDCAKPPKDLMFETDGRRYYKVAGVEYDQRDPYKFVGIYGTVNQVYANRYEFVDPLAPEDPPLVPSIVWADKTPVANVGYTNTFRTGSDDGGFDGHVAAQNVSVGDLKVIGHGPNNQPLYEVPITSALFKAIYEVYRTDSPTFMSDKPSLQNLTEQQFQDKHVIFLAKSPIGELLVYLRGDFNLKGL